MMNMLRLFLLVVTLASIRLLPGDTASAVATVTAGFVSGITVTSGGSGYTSEPFVKITGGGGTGATAKAILTGDKVTTVIVLTAGNGYDAVPAVAIESPPKSRSLAIGLVPKLTIDGIEGSPFRVEWSTAFDGPWNLWTNATTAADGTVLVDLGVDATSKYYRTVEIRRQGFGWIKAGSFQMGSPEQEAGRSSWETLHKVTISKGFWLSDHEVTQREYQDLIGSNPSVNKNPDSPVENVSWEDANEYCRRLTDLHRSQGLIEPAQQYRLPTESEWEYAARAGTTTATYGPIDDIAWYTPNSNGTPKPVKTKAPNAWGLYDMLGNVNEWCSDQFGYYPGSAVDPQGPSSPWGPGRVYRGGAINDGNGGNVRAAVRSWMEPFLRREFIGFRPALDFP